MSGSPSKPPLTLQVEGMPNYVMLPNTSQTKPVHFVQGLDGMIYPFTPGAGTSSTAKHAADRLTDSATPKSSGIAQPCSGTMPPIPQGINFATSTAPASMPAGGQINVGALTAGGQMNVGALAATAALQGQSAAATLPFIPIYLPFSMPSSLTQSPALSMQPFPLRGGQAVASAGLFQLPSLVHSGSGSDRRSSSTHSMSSPSDLVSTSDRRTNQFQSRSSSNTSAECSPSPTVSKTATEFPFGTSWGKTSSGASSVSANREVYSSTIVTSNYGGLDLSYRAAVLQDETSTTAHERHRTPTPDKEAKMETNGLHSVRTRSSLSRYVHPTAASKSQAPSSTAGAPSLERLLQTNSESKDTCNTVSASLQGTNVVSDHSMLALLQEEQHLVQFYDFFNKSQLSRHLRLRFLTTEGGANVLKWIEVTRNASHIEPSFGPVDAARILISSNGLCKLQLIFPYPKTLLTRFVPMTMAQANDLFSELSLKHVVCPGLPDCESKINTLGYQPTNIRVVETPSMKRYDHEKCPIWHIPLPCNLYSESGQILHHMCKQCKNLLNTLNKTITKIAGLNVSSMLKGNELSLFNMAMVGSTGPTLSSPHLLRSPPSTSSQEQLKTETNNGRNKRKRKAHPKDNETSGSLKSSSVHPARIYQLLQSDLTSESPTHSVANSASTLRSTTATSERTAVSAYSEHTSDILTSTSSVVVLSRTSDHEGEEPVEGGSSTSVDDNCVNPDPEMSEVEEHTEKEEEEEEDDDEKGEWQRGEVPSSAMSMQWRAGATSRVVKHRLEKSDTNQKLSDAEFSHAPYSQELRNSHTDCSDVADTIKKRKRHH